MAGIAVHLCVALAFFSAWVEAALVNIDSEVFYIVSKHNEERKSYKLQASDMMELQWDTRLANEAAQWSERCVYQRPSKERSGYGVNSNLFFETDHVYGEKAIRRLVKTAVQSWANTQERFKYEPQCGRACSYVNMIYSTTNRIGCALSTCDDLRSGTFVAEYASMLVCFYSPGSNLMSSLPYSRGRACSRCSPGMECRSGLCAQPGSFNMPPELIAMSDEQQRRRPSAIFQPQDKLSRNESYFALEAHNRIREDQRDQRISRKLEWDSYLERWATWVCSCKADYPGPSGAYSNFERLDQGTSVYDTISAWSKERTNLNLNFVHGCRTPNDRTKCNHFTNVIEPSLTSMACAALDCNDGSRQLICLYDNRQVRDDRVREATAALARLEDDQNARLQALNANKLRRQENNNSRNRAVTDNRRPQPVTDTRRPQRVLSRDERNRRRQERLNRRREEQLREQRRRDREEQLRNQRNRDQYRYGGDTKPFTDNTEERRKYEEERRRKYREEQLRAQRNRDQYRYGGNAQQFTGNREERRNYRYSRGQRVYY